MREGDPRSTVLAGRGATALCGRDQILKHLAMEKFQIDIKDALLRKLRWRHESYILNVVIVSVRDEFASAAAHFVEDVDARTFSRFDL